MWWEQMSSQAGLCVAPRLLPRLTASLSAMGESRSLLLLLTTFCSLLVLPSHTEASRTYNTGAGPVPGKLNVHLVPHTHNDLGWLLTADQYYIGPDATRSGNFQNNAVQFILHTIVQELDEDPNRKFSYVETGFFARWWREQSPTKQAKVKKLVKSGQLEFLNGGWCMHDEAATHYIDMIDQTTLGHRHLMNYFGIVPRNGWQIDPFGHSAVQAYLLTAEAGFDAMFSARIDYQDRAARTADKTMEMIWRGSDTLGATSQIFMGVFPHHYSPPSGFLFEYDDSNYVPVQDDPYLDEYNVDQRVNDLVQQAQQQAAMTRTNHIMWTMGDDFCYQSASIWYNAMDKLIDYANLDGRVNVLYSTPTLYLESKNAANETWPLKTGDFFPYADSADSYWTGYFTSRPALKGYVRTLSGYLQAARQLEFLAGRQNKTAGGFTTDSLEEAMATAQHHDAVSGTEKQAVADDYARGLFIGAEESKHVINEALGILGNGAQANVTFQQCAQLNVSYCPGTENNTYFVVVVYNQLAWSRAEYIRLPVSRQDLSVIDPTGNVIQSQIIPVSNVTRELRDFYVQANLGETPSNGDLFHLVFQSSVPPLGFTSYVIQLSSGGSDAAVMSKVELSGQTNNSGQTLQIGHGDVILTFSSATGHLVSMYTNQTGSHNMSQTYHYYEGSDGSQTGGQASGAYIFQPSDNTTTSLDSTVYNTTVVRGPLVEEIWQESPWVSQVMRLYKGEEHVEVEFTIGPIPLDDGIGKEVITRISTDINTNKKFFTDSNGRDFLERERDYRDSWNLSVVQPIAGNYYPINLGMYVTDNVTDFSVLVDRAVGGASITDGQVELMLHRRLLYDDSRGVGEPLDEQVCLGTNNTNCEGLTIRGRYFLSMKTKTDAALWRRTQGQAILSPPVLAFTEDWNNATRIFSAMAPNTTLPVNVALLTLQELDSGDVLLRLAHLYQANEHPDLSQLATVELKNVFYGHEITNATEMSLTANQAKSAMRKPLLWNVEGETVPANTPVRGTPFNASSLQVVLGPMEIRTFLIQVSA